MKDFQCPWNLYYITENCFKEQYANRHKNKPIFPQYSCCGQGYWNIQHNSLLNLNFAKWTISIAFADDLLIAVKAATVAEVENLMNMKMSKFTKWSKENKSYFKNQKQR
jgi:hypothetical protein